MRPSDIPAIAGLSAVEKIFLVEDLWDEISADNERVGVPQSHKDELDRRMENHKRYPGRLLSLEELQRNIGIGN
jgi:putative addiction module component (TIGR02574 family)